MNHVLANNALPLAIEIQGFCLMREVGMLKGLTTHCSMVTHLCCCHFPYEFFLTWVPGHLSQLAHVVITGIISLVNELLLLWCLHCVCTVKSNIGHYLPRRLL